jgi:hypothetical protein
MVGLSASKGFKYSFEICKKKGFELLRPVGTQRNSQEEKDENMSDKKWEQSFFYYKKLKDPLQ